jgi:diguanylate cyclase (GGDEF)-like protein/PAS domain S-box-containing protein
MGATPDVHVTGEELRRARALAARLLGHGADIGFVTDRHGVITSVTDSVRSVLGLAPEDLVGRHGWSVLETGSLEVSREQVGERVALPADQAGFTAGMRDADGRLHHVEVLIHNLVDEPAIDGFVVNVRDVTERFEMIAALRGAEARQRAIVEHASDLILFFQPDATIDWVSPASRDIFGIEPEDLVGRNGYALIHPDDRARVEEAFAGMRGLRSHVRVSFRVVDGDGTVRWVEEVATNLLEDPDVGCVVGNLRDITEQRHAAEALAASEARYRSILETAQEGIWVTDRTGATVFVNPTMAALLATDVEALHRARVLDFVPPEERPPVAAREAMSASGSVERFEARFVRGDGSMLWAIVGASPLRTPDGEPAGTLYMVSDITDRKRMEEQLERLALYDALTGLPNRGLVVNRLDHCLARRSDACTGVVFVDVDNFKDVNDSLGHTAGDLLLAEVGRRLRASARAEDTVARFGGDEFVVLCEDVRSSAEAVAIAERLLSSLKGPVELPGGQVFVSASFGVALGPADDAATLIRRADLAMYRAKEHGRAQVVLFDDRLHDATPERFRVQTELRSAIDRRELCLHYQPIVDLTRVRVVGVEALVRWQHPERGLVMPDQFVGIAETTGLIRELGAAVLEDACRAAAGWRAGGRPMRVAVNLAAPQVGDEALPELVAGILASTDFPPEMLTLEVTESAAMRDSATSTRTLRALRRLGVNLALDDFGTGYSSLSFLKALPVNAVKIDQTFVAGLGGRSDDTLIVAGVVSMAHALGHQVVAEGVETEAQLNVLRGLGCRYAQGYLFAGPVPEAELPGALAHVEQRARTAAPVTGSPRSAAR